MKDECEKRLPPIDFGGHVGGGRLPSLDEGPAPACQLKTYLVHKIDGSTRRITAAKYHIEAGYFEFTGGSKPVRIKAASVAEIELAD